MVSLCKILQFKNVNLNLLSLTLPEKRRTDAHQSVYDESAIRYSAAVSTLMRSS